MTHCLVRPLGDVSCVVLRDGLCDVGAYDLHLRVGHLLRHVLGLVHGLVLGRGHVAGLVLGLGDVGGDSLGLGVENGLEASLELGVDGRLKVGDLLGDGHGDVRGLYLGHVGGLVLGLVLDAVAGRGDVAGLVDRGIHRHLQGVTRRVKSTCGRGNWFETRTSLVIYPFILRSEITSRKNHMKS